jgi:beta-lactamase regulating signal transducer with metallopeptidase domain
MLVTLLLWVTLTILHNGSARLRYTASCAALTIMIALPFLTGFMVYRTPVTASTRAGEFADISASAVATALPATGWLLVWVAVLEEWVVPIWSLGVFAFAVRLIWGTREIARLQRKGEPAEASVSSTVSRLARRMKVDRSVRVLISELIDSPSLVGWLRPVILLPAAASLHLSVDQLEAVLAHEVAHVRRRDYLVNMLQNLVETLFFYHPAVWWVSSRIRRERELCCDDLVVEVCGDAIGYARALAKLERLRAISPELAMSSTGGPLLYRIHRLTGLEKEQPPSKLPAIFALSMALLCLMWNLNWAYAEPQSRREALVPRDAIWVDTVKYGDFPVLVRALGTITTPGTAELKVAESQAHSVQNGQAAAVELRRGITIAGKVTRIDSQVVNGTVTVVVELEAPAPEFRGEPVDGIIQIRTIKNVVYIGRPAAAVSSGESTIFKVDSDGTHATRIKVRFGVQSVTSVQVLDGLQPGDRVILSDTTRYKSFERIRLE